jgi:hypothetical protein
MQAMKTLVVLGALALGACTEDLELRLCNRSSYALTEVEASEFKGVNLVAGECTEYRPATGRSYPTECVWATLGGGEALMFCPLDQVGASPLPGGRWSYEISVDGPASPHRIWMRAVEDDD